MAQRLMEFSNPQVQRRVDAFRANSDQKVLDLSDTEARNADLACIARGPRAERLTVLDLNGTSIDSEGLKQLAGMRWLKSLFLEDTSVDSDGMRYLKGLPPLSRLSLGGTPLGNEGLEHIASVRTLTLLDVFDTSIQ